MNFKKNIPYIEKSLLVLSFALITFAGHFIWKRHTEKLSLQSKIPEVKQRLLAHLSDKNSFLLSSLAGVGKKSHCYDDLERKIANLKDYDLKKQQDFDRLDVILNEINPIVGECLSVLMKNNPSAAQSMVKRLQRIELTIDHERQEYTKTAFNYSASSPGFRAEKLILRQ